MHITKGSTYRDTLRWATSECVFASISGVQLLAPCRLTVAGHGVPPRWRVAITNVKGSVELNAADNPPKPGQYVWARVVDPNTVELPCVDATGFKAYKGGGVLRYKAPVDLGGYTARMHIRDKAGNLLIDLTTEAAAGEPRIVLDNVEKTITREIPAAVTAAIDWKSATYDLEMVSGTGVVKIDAGSVTVGEEITK